MKHITIISLAVFFSAACSSASNTTSTLEGGAEILTSEQVSPIKQLFDDDKFDGAESVVAQFFASVEEGRWIIPRGATELEKDEHETCLKGLAKRTADRWEQPGYRVEIDTLVVADWEGGEKVGIVYTSNGSGFGKYKSHKMTVELASCSLLFAEYGHNLRVLFTGATDLSSHNGVYHDPMTWRSTYFVNPTQKQIFTFMDDQFDDVTVAGIENERDCKTVLKDKTRSDRIEDICSFDKESAQVTSSYSQLMLYDFLEQNVAEWQELGLPNTSNKPLYLDRSDRPGLMYQFVYQNNEPKEFSSDRWRYVVSR